MPANYHLNYGKHPAVYVAEATKSYMNVMASTSCCLTFFGFLCISEFTVPSNDQYDEEYHLCLNDMVIDTLDNPQMLQVKIKQSKTEPFGKRINIYLSAIRRDLCPVRGILQS